MARVAKGQIQVRTARESDAAALVPLLEQLGYPATEEQIRSRLRTLSESSRDSVFVAELREGSAEWVVAGVAAVEVAPVLHVDAPHADLTALVTDRQFRHRGVARALLRAVEDLARREACYVLHVRSNRQRDDAHAFYRAVGFEETHLTFNKAL